MDSLDRSKSFCLCDIDIDASRALTGVGLWLWSCFLPIRSKLGFASLQQGQGIKSLLPKVYDVTGTRAAVVHFTGVLHGCPWCQPTLRAIPTSQSLVLLIMIFSLSCQVSWAKGNKRITSGDEPINLPALMVQDCVAENAGHWVRWVAACRSN